jgi:hypothetical protein
VMADGGTLDVTVKVHAVTDEMVERAARFDWEAHSAAWAPTTTWDDLDDVERQDYLRHARGMLVAAVTPQEQP